MPMTKCGHCGAPTYIGEKHKDEGVEVYCSEACAKGESDDEFAPPVQTPDEDDIECDDDLGVDE